MNFLMPHTDFLPEVGYPFSLAGEPLRPRVVTADEPGRHRRAAGELVGLSGLVKTFDGPQGPVRAVDGVDLSIRRGEIFGIIGQSGAGKSTLIRCINLLERPSSGEILIDGEAVQDLPDARLPALRRRIGMIFQHFNLLSAKTVAENVALPMRLAGRSAWEIANRVPALLELVGLADKAEAYPAKLSGGQKQRVGIARALALQPEILLCDEATSALDPATTLQILALLKDVNRRLGITVVLITHEMAVVREICDRVAVIEAGRVIEQGSVFDVFTRPRTPAARQLLQGILPALPSFLRERLLAAPRGPSEVILRLQVAGQAALEPVVADLAREQDLPVSVIHGAIDYIQEQPAGVLFLALQPHGPAQLARAVAYLRARVVEVEVMGYVPRAA